MDHVTLLTVNFQTKFECAMLSIVKIYFEFHKPSPPWDM